MKNLEYWKNLKTSLRELNETLCKMSALNAVKKTSTKGKQIHRAYELNNKLRNVLEDVSTFDGFDVDFFSKTHEPCNIKKK